MTPIAPSCPPALRLAWCEQTLSVEPGGVAVLETAVPGLVKEDADHAQADALLRELLGEPAPVDCMAGTVSARCTLLGSDWTDLASLGYADLQRWRAAAGYVHRHDALLENRSVFENLTLRGRYFGVADVDTTAERLLDAAGLAHRRNHRPVACGNDERGRLLMLRALSTRPGLILMEGPLPEGWDLNAWYAAAEMPTPTRVHATRR